MNSDTVYIVKAPQVNVNDENVKIVDWHVEHGQKVKNSQLICEIETVKSVEEVYADQEGIIYHVQSKDAEVKVGEPLAYIGSSVEDIEQHIKNIKPQAKASFTDGLKITPKAQSLIEQYNIALNEINTIKFKGSLKESDIKGFLEKKGLIKNDSHIETSVNLPAALLELTTNEGMLSVKDKYVADNLRFAQSQTLATTIEADLDAVYVNKIINTHKQNGVVLSPLHVIISALSRTLLKYPKFVKFVFNQNVYSYRNIDIGFIVTTFSDQLYAPVIRQADTLTLQEISNKVQQLVLKANRDQLGGSELGGACFGISFIPDSTTKRFTALMDRFQSAILAVAAERTELRMRDGKVQEEKVMSLTLSYDHSLIDGFYASRFLSDFKKEIINTAG